MSHQNSNPFSSSSHSLLTNNPTTEDLDPEQAAHPTNIQVQTNGNLEGLDSYSVSNMDSADYGGSTVPLKPVRSTSTSKSTPRTYPLSKIDTNDVNMRAREEHLNPPALIEVPPTPVTPRNNDSHDTEPSMISWTETPSRTVTGNARVGNEMEMVSFSRTSGRSGTGDESISRWTGDRRKSGNRVFTFDPDSEGDGEGAPSPPRSISPHVRSRWHSAARRALQVKQLTSANGALDYVWGHSEPGIDPRRTDLDFVEGLKGGVNVEVVDYDEAHVRFESFLPSPSSSKRNTTTTAEDKSPNFEFIDWLENGRGRLDQRPKWSKVRWINVKGVSWDVLRSLALNYDLHPLALEDTLHLETGPSTAKADFYSNHLFLALSMHSMGTSSLSNANNTKNKKRKTHHRGHSHSIFPPVARSRAKRNTIIGGKGGRGREDSSDGDPDRSAAMEYYDSVPEDEGLGGDELMVPGGEEDEDVLNDKNWDSTEGTLPRAVKTRGGKISQNPEVAKHTVEHLTLKYKTNVISWPMSAFLMRDGTLITIFQDGGSESIDPLSKRLRESQTLLRMTADPSMLLQGIVDLVGEHLTKIVETFRQQITVLEGQVMVAPDIDTVRRLHVLSCDLLLLKRKFQPVSSMIHSLRNHKRYDAFARPSRSYSGNQLSNTGSTTSSIHRSSSNNSLPNQNESDGDPFSDQSQLQQRPPIISRQAELYLADTLGDVASALDSLELFSGLASNLVDFTFNTISWDTNEYMMDMSMVSVLFLPLTFLCGYFGMNWGKFDGVIGDNDSVILFWKIAVPVMIIFCVLFGSGYLSRKFGFFRRRFIRYQYARK